MRIEVYLDRLATTSLRQALALEEDVPSLLRPTQDAKFGDYQVNGVIALAKRLGRPPRDLASKVADLLAADDAIASTEVAGPGFINLRLRDDWLAARLTETLRDKARDGVAPVEMPEKIVVDYSSPNVAKQMHVGHLRSTIIGASIVKVLRFLGHDVIGDNHLGDWGTQFGLLILGMQRWGNAEALAHNAIVELERVYRIANATAEKETAFADEARRELAKLQAGDPESRAQWERFIVATRSALDQIYERLDVRFDEWLGESAYHDALPEVVTQLLSHNIAREDDGAICVFFQELEGVPEDLGKLKAPFIVRKKDGAYLYSTTDIATVLYRRDRFHAQRSVYVVDARQSLHFKQLFAVVQRLGVEMRLDHVSFGTVLGKDGKPLRTRDGELVTLAALLDEAEERAVARIREAKLDIPEDKITETARAVGIGAVKYADLRQNRTSDYQFDWDKMISFQGNAGPYLQYAHARICSIFRKGEVVLDEVYANANIAVREPAESTLARVLLRFPDVIHQTAENYQPHLICDHLYELARAFSTFYEACPVLRAEPEVRDARLGLTALAARQLARGLGLLGIAAPDRM